MSGHGRPISACAISTCGCFVIALISSATSLSQMIDWPLPVHWQDDAELTDVVFVDSQQGWVVGEHGLVLRTSDGGENWETINLGVRCRLETVHFVDSQFGWIAGGFRFPTASSSQAVIFRTIDGGATWKRVEGLSLPKLNRVRFDNPAQGWALGDSSATHPGGIFTTSDGGLTWSSPARGELQNWITGDRFGDQFVLTTPLGHPAVKSGDQPPQPGYFPESRPTVIRQMRLWDAQRGMAVGTGGTVLTTRNGGLSWHPWKAAGPLSQLDIHTFVRNDQVYWFAGSPGSFLFRFDEKTGAMEKRVMPSRSAIRKLTFQSSDLLWAITANGEIMKTTDGGETWSMTRRGGKQLGVLQIVLEPDQVNLELFARQCASENHRGATTWLDPGTSTKSSVLQQTLQLDAVRQATVRVGASYVEYHDPIRSGDGTPHDAVHKWLVRELREQRPLLVVIPDVAALDNGLDLQSLVLQAVRDAADSQVYAEQISGPGLSPWQVLRVARHRFGTTGEFKIGPNEYLPGMGCLVGDLVTPSRWLLSQNAVPDAKSCFSTVYVSPLAAGASTLIPAPDRAGRPGSSRASGSLPRMRLLAGKSKTMRQLGVINTDQVQNPNVMIQRIVETVSQLDDATAGVWMFELAETFHQQGHSELAAQIHGHFARTLRQHPLAVASLRWIYQYYASDEMALLFAKSLQAVQPQSTLAKQPAPGPRTRPVTTVKDGIVTTEWQVVDAQEPSAESDPRQVQNPSWMPVAWNEEQKTAVTRRRWMQANVVPQSLALIDYSAPQSEGMLLSRSLLNGKLDAATPLDQQLKSIASQTMYPGEANRARREMRIRQLSPGKVQNQLTSVFATTRPRLDGRFDDPIWQSESISQATAYVTGENESIAFAHDREYLYLAIRCRKQPGISYAKTVEPRRADDDLSRSDRIELAFDTDRDPNVCFLLAIDSNGRLADACGDNLAWNPRWYVASRQDDQAWYAEAAMNLDQLRWEGSDMTWTIHLARWAGNRHMASWPAGEDAFGNRQRQSRLGPGSPPADVASCYISTIGPNRVSATTSRLEFGVLKLGNGPFGDPLQPAPGQQVPDRAPAEGFPKIRSLPKR